MDKREVHTVWKNDKGEVLLLVFVPEAEHYSLNFRTAFGEFRKLEFLPMESIPQLVLYLSQKMGGEEKRKLSQILVGSPLYFRNKKGQIQRLLPGPLEKLVV